MILFTSMMSPSKSHLYDGDDGNEDRWGTQAVLVKVPAPVCLTGQDLVGHITNKTFVQTQPRLVKQDLPLQSAAAIGDGSSETAGALTAHLRKKVRKKTKHACITLTRSVKYVVNNCFS